MRSSEINKTPVLVQHMLDGRLEGRTVDWITFTDYSTGFSSSTDASYYFRGNINISSDVVAKVHGMVDFVYHSSHKLILELDHATVLLHNNGKYNYEYYRHALHAHIQTQHSHIGKLTQEFADDLRTEVLRVRNQIFAGFRAQSPPRT